MNQDSITTVIQQQGFFVPARPEVAGQTSNSASRVVTEAANHRIYEDRILVLVDCKEVQRIGRAAVDEMASIGGRVNVEQAALAGSAPFREFTEILAFAIVFSPAGQQSGLPR